MENRELELKDDIGHHRLFWRLKRIAWVVMLIVVLVTIGGFTGGGMTSERTIVNGDISVTYEKYSRRAAVVFFRINLENVQTDTFSLTFGNEYLKDIRIEDITPQPIFQKLSEKGESFYFLKGSDIKNAEITFHLKPLKNGTFNFDVSSDTKSIHVQQLILP